MFEFLLMIAGLGLFAYVNQQSSKLTTLANEVRGLKKQVEDLNLKSLNSTKPQDAPVSKPAVEGDQLAAVDSLPAPSPARSSEEAESQVLSEQILAVEETTAPAPQPDHLDENLVLHQNEARNEPDVPASASPAEVQNVPSTPTSVVTNTDKPKESLESKLGARWTVWVGGLALAVGGLFMVKYSIENVLVSPALRLSFAALFGIALFAAGEVVRRRIGRFASTVFQNAMVPGVLTAAGSLTLMGSIFAAHMFYGYLGSGTAFTLLALVSLATVGLSLMHGQTLAGLGLLAAFATPLAVRSAEPNPWALFLFLVVAWVSTNLAARFRGWKLVPMMANLGLSFWCILYVLDTSSGTWPVTFATLCMVLGTAFLWPGALADADVPPKKVGKAAMAPPLQDQSGFAAGGAGDVEAPPEIRRQNAVTPVMDLLFGPFSANIISMALGTMLVGLFLLATGSTGTGMPENPVPAFVTLVTVMTAFGYYRLQAGFSALAGAGLAILGFFVLSSPLIGSGIVAPGIVQAVVNHDTALYTSFVLSFIFIGLGAFKALVLRNPNEKLAQLFATITVGIPFSILVLAYFAAGNFTRDWTFGLATVLAGLAFVVIAEILHRGSETIEQSAGNPVIATYIAGSALNFIFAIHAVANGITTTLLVAGLGFAYVLAVRLRPWTILPWTMGLADVVVMARIGWNPTIVSAEALSKTPFFNALLPGYGIPTLLTALAAYDMRKRGSASVRNFLDALASLGVLLTIAILVRHAMNGGVLDSSAPTLAEQSIYTLLAIGASAVMMTLDIRSPSPVFRWGSMAVGVLSILSILLAHLLTLNPVQTGEHTGSWPIFDLLFIGYFLPGLAAMGLAYYAENKRPRLFRNLIESAGTILLLVWVPLELRHLFHGAILLSGTHLDEAEAFLWPVGWLALSFVHSAVGQYLKKGSADLPESDWIPVTFVKSLQNASLVFAGVSVLALVFSNLVYMNPYFSGESTGTSAILNLLLLGYFVPAALIWLRALVGRRTGEHVIVQIGLSVFGFILMFAYITLAVRRSWQGEYIGSWNGFLQGETYTYSVVWLIFGVLLLILGSHLNAISLRLASAAIVFVTVGKVFLFDMSNLEGILRALSFIGLGLVLIAIGLFYQRVLGNLALPKSGGAGLSDSDKGEQA